jgi:hypothetical protein
MKKSIIFVYKYTPFVRTVICAFKKTECRGLDHTCENPFGLLDFANTTTPQSVMHDGFYGEPLASLRTTCPTAKSAHHLGDISSGVLFCSERKDKSNHFTYPNFIQYFFVWSK